MVKLKFVVKDDALVLRISEGKERFYRSVMSLLLGNPNLKYHWNQEKERFRCSSPYYKENNAAIESFKGLYQKAVFAEDKMSARDVSVYYDAPPSTCNYPIKTAEDLSYTKSPKKFLEKVIEREKAKPGCNFEIYKKLLNKLGRVYPEFDRLKFSDIDYDKCMEIAKIFAQHRGYAHSAKQFRNFLGKADKDRRVPFKISQIGDFNFKDYDPDRDHAVFKRPDVLTQEQVAKFMNLDLSRVTPNFQDRNRVRLYYDFCVFMLHSFFSPCDVIKLKYSEIKNMKTISANRKKTHRAVEVPVSPVMDGIIVRYRPFSKDDYVFPIMDDEKAEQYSTRDYIFKKFNEDLNIWLKDLGRELGVGFRMYSYVFRHTAITLALDNGLPLAYVASVAGTSIEMIQKHYYNGENEKNSMKLKMMFMKVAAV